MSYTMFFDPNGESSAPRTRAASSGPPEVPTLAGDAAGRSTYVYSEKVILTVNIGLATGRPVLVSGDPGTGKTSLAANVARELKWRFYKHVVTSSTEASDLLWRYDAVQRIGDAQAQKLPAKRSTAWYVEPGPMWWALNRDDAIQRGAGDLPQKRHVEDPTEMNAGADRAVILVDEIDKADPDLPNDLLEVLGSRRFTVRETQHTVMGETPPFVFVTTNDERDLPQAFLRRCIKLELPPIDEAHLVKVGGAHVGDAVNADLIKAAAKKTIEQGAWAAEKRLRKPSTAEFLDLLWACHHLKIDGVEHPEWKKVARATLWKEDAPADAGEALGREGAEQ